MKIPLKDAYRILENCSGIVINGAVTYPALYELTGEDDNQFLYFSWDEGYSEMSQTFEEAHNGEVDITESYMTLYDMEGDPTTIQILIPQDLQAFLAAPQARCQKKTPLDPEGIKRLTEILYGIYEKKGYTGVFDYKIENPRYFWSYDTFCGACEMHTPTILGDNTCAVCSSLRD
jgi:hypothetical protein